MDKDNRKLLLTEIFIVLFAWLIFLAVFTLKNGCDLSIERQVSILFASSLTAGGFVVVVAIAAILGMANLFAASIVAAGFMAAGSYFAQFRFSFVALAVIGLLAGWLILKMAGTEIDKKRMKFSAISLTVQGLLILLPVFLLIFG